MVTASPTPPLDPAVAKAPGEPPSAVSPPIIHSTIVTVEINRIINAVLQLGKRGVPRRMTVPIGHVMVANYDGYKAYDHHGLPEVYLPGETVVRRFFRGADCQVVDFNEYPGTVSITLTQRLLGLSLSESDKSVARFRYQLRLSDPVKLLSLEPMWMSPTGPEDIKRKVEEQIKDELTAVLGSDIQVWSAGDIKQVAEFIFISLDRQLASLGIRLSAEVGAFRQHPARLYEVALQIRGAEQDLLDQGLVDADLLLDRLGLYRTDLMQVRSDSDRRTVGVGLFLLVRRNRGRVEDFASWLETEAGAIDAARFFRELYSVATSPRRQEVTLSEQLVLAAMANSFLTVGEWEESAR